MIVRGGKSHRDGQHPRPGVAYRPLRDAPPMPVSIAWWIDNPPPLAPPFVALVCAALAP